MLMARALKRLLVEDAKEDLDTSQQFWMRAHNLQFSWQQ